MKSTSIVLAVALTAFAASAHANDYKVGALEIDHPWSRATPKGAKTAAGYMAIKNTGSEPDRLVAGSLTSAGSGQVHEMTSENGVMKMRPLSGGLEIKPGETVDLKPGGLHLMFLDLKQPLAKGQPVKGTLTFEKAGKVDVEFSVEAMGASGSSQEMGTMKSPEMGKMKMH